MRERERKEKKEEKEGSREKERERGAFSLIDLHMNAEKTVPTNPSYNKQVFSDKYT